MKTTIENEKTHLDWWESLSNEESTELEKKHGYYGHDIGTSTADVLEIWKFEGCPAPLSPSASTPIEEKTDLICMVCNKEFKGKEPEMCCSGRDCGCMGMPIDPIVCSSECYDNLPLNKSKREAIEIAESEKWDAVIEDVTVDFLDTNEWQKIQPFCYRLRQMYHPPTAKANNKKSSALSFSKPNESNFGIDDTHTLAKFGDYEFDIRYDCESTIKKPVNGLMWLNIYHYGKKIGTASDKDVQKLINYSEKFLKNEKLKLENVL